MAVSARTVLLIGGLAAFLGALVVFLRRRFGVFDFTEAKKQAFRTTLTVGTPAGRAATYADEILRVAAEEQVNPFLIVAVMERESQSGRALSPPGPTGTGDGGHGRGLMQIDDRSHMAFVATGKWTDPYENIKYAVASVLKPNLRYFSVKGFVGDRLTRAALAAYNAGPGAVLSAVQAGRDIDAPTAHQNYSADVLSRFASLTLNFQQRLGTA